MINYYYYNKQIGITAKDFFTVDFCNKCNIVKAVVFLQKCTFKTIF